MRRVLLAFTTLALTLAAGLAAPAGGEQDLVVLDGGGGELGDDVLAVAEELESLHGTSLCDVRRTLRL